MHECGYIAEGICYRWNVLTLFEAAKDLVSFDFLVDQVDLKNCFWFKENPSVEEVLIHFRKLNNIDFTHPIILAPDGTILDGIHRVARARLDQLKTIKAVQFEILPEADSQTYVNDQKFL